jgi:tRNA-2-methylthio-N6-dimethylallyladenosine synthase
MLKKQTYFVWILGCAMNKADGERVATVLEKMGYAPAKSEKTANLIAVVACSVRQSGIDRILGKANAWKKSGTTMILTGCVLPSDKPKMAKIFHLTFDIKELAKLPAMLKKINVKK